MQGTERAEQRLGRAVGVTEKACRATATKVKATSFICYHGCKRQHNTMEKINQELEDLQLSARTEA
jgi:hypothetical protein